ncbi:MAG: hypothetical protein O7G30_03875 [Proteobacteria bacterium]|nr:hypothetical protein [Pseudomonadota bacterium]
MRKSIPAIEKALVATVRGIAIAVEGALGWRHHWGAWRRSFATPVIGPRRQPPFVL